jgi:hypothetical protein
MDAFNTVTQVDSPRCCEFGEDLVSDTGRHEGECVCVCEGAIPSAESAQKEVATVVRIDLSQRHTNGKRREKGFYDSLPGKGQARGLRMYATCEASREGKERWKREGRSYLRQTTRRRSNKRWYRRCGSIYRIVVRCSTASAGAAGTRRGLLARI